MCEQMLMLTVAAAAAEQPSVGEFPARCIRLGADSRVTFTLQSGNLCAEYVAIVIDVVHEMLHKDCLHSAISLSRFLCDINQLSRASIQFFISFLEHHLGK